MRTHHSLFRLTAAVAIGGLVAGQGFAPLAYAQDAPPAPAPADGAAPAPGPAPADATAAVDPPARVGRLAALTGTVSFHTIDQTDWQFASLNYPITSGNYFWTEPKANAALGLGGVKVVLDQQTEADVDTLTDAKLEITEPQGALYIHVRELAPNSTATVTTPRGIVSITAPGRYEVVAGDSEQPTRVVVIDGAASIAVGDGTLAVAPGQSASVVGSDQTSFQGSVGTASQDPFITAELNKEKPAAPKPAQAVVATAAPAYVPPPLVQQMTGYESLEEVGDWRPSPQYGHVWFPPVQANYVPYRNGHWAYVAPWGWTWVDNAPWGFAPFHYGRWAQVDNRWGWVPEQPGIQVDVGVRPVYAPALVSFVGFGVGVAVGAAIGAALGGGGGSVGWVPLAPNEPYIPAFRASPSYVRNVNINHVSNVTNITNITNNTTTINNYANASAATVVPAQTMTASAPVAPAVQHFTPQQFAAAKPVAVAQAPVQPTLQTAGVTPTVAQQLKLAPVAPATAPAGAKPGTPAAQTALVAPKKPAPGPAIAPTPQAIAAGAVVAKPAGAVTPPVAPGAKPGVPAATPGKPATPALVAKPGSAPPAIAAKPGTTPPVVAGAPKPPVAGTAPKPAEAAAAPKPAETMAPKPGEAAVAPKPAETTAPKPAETAVVPKPATPASATPSKPALPALVQPVKSATAPSSVAPVPKTHAAPPPAPAAKPAATPAVTKPAPPAKAAAPAKPAPAPVKPPVHQATAAPAPKPAPAKPAEKKCPPNEKTC